MEDTYHEDIISAYEELKKRNQEEVDRTMEQAKELYGIPAECNCCRHAFGGYCDVQKKLCRICIDICAQAGWYESGVIEVVPQATVHEINGRRTPTTGELADRMEGNQ